MNNRTAPLYQNIARIIGILHLHVEDIPQETLNRIGERTLYYEKNCLPRGSGFDVGTTIDENQSKPDRLVLTFEYHHMNEHGFYCGWSQWSCIIKPCLQFGYTMRFMCHGLADQSWEIRQMVDSNFRDYLHQVFSHDLNKQTPCYPECEQ